MSSSPYSCQIDVVFPTNEQAKNAIQVLQVDREPGGRVSKSFSIVEPVVSNSEQSESTALLRV